MTRDVININDFIILVEEAKAEKVTIDSCFFDEPIIAVAFYGSGNVDLSVKYGDKQKEFSYTKGLALSFYADDNVEFIHTVSASKQLECLVIATSISAIEALPNDEGELFSEMLNQLVNPSDHYVEGPAFYMTPEMQTIVDSIFNIQYEGKTKMMFFRSQITALLSHFFGQLATMKTEKIKTSEREKLIKAKTILSENLDNPPSLTELSKEIGLNTFKLKKDFKELFGVPVFKYLQNERLTIAHKLIRKQEATVQEAAWHVGYDSLSSFSNAFAKKFGYRPSQIK
ncbi:AraC family transcriptional regulator [Flavobacteriaceae bacterium S0825]|uniref:helix-turn-helix transcriptional regulator n=1 Tax=Gaetbulibacter sp. S0825 TaxID=2720084 RepID=UPI001431657E|nr:helix-turn-helix domain-containing protein [Gaetbulibacter sp. S0825]MCK0107888.1 AraC family transcriptional regulator [Flavobacteriaceae bacterium S0825]NIX63524.1 helix-turn-helix transcriptional regulator [Gaetbulibacter sp. S0825]